jgi:hypothetical protein
VAHWPPAAPGRRPAAPGRRRAKYELVFTDRLMVTLAHLCPGSTHGAPGVIYQVGSSTIGRAIGEIRQLWPNAGSPSRSDHACAPAYPGRVFAYAEAENVTLRIDGAETQVRRPKGRTPRTGRLRLRQAQAEHDQDHHHHHHHHHQRRPRTHPVVRGGAAWPDARPRRQTSRPPPAQHRTRVRLPHRTAEPPDPHHASMPRPQSRGRS